MRACKDVGEVVPNIYNYYFLLLVPYLILTSKAHVLKVNLKDLSKSFNSVILDIFAFLFSDL